MPETKILSAKQYVARRAQKLAKLAQISEEFADVNNRPMFSVDGFDAYLLEDGSVETEGLLTSRDFKAFKIWLDQIFP